MPGGSEVKRHSNNQELAEAVWPDPDPYLASRKSVQTAKDTHYNGATSIILLDDISRMSKQAVSRIFYVRNEEDIKTAMQHAIDREGFVCIRGTQHSMGGHTLCENGYQIDLKCLKHVFYDTESGLVTCGSGAVWADLIRELNKYGKSPRTMQSYCTFSVGGTLSVNGHGITTDFSLSECVTSFRLVRPDAEAGKVEVIECKRGQYGQPATKSSELFSAVLGGYGVFGVISEITMHVCDNTHLECDAFQCTTIGETADFEHVHKETRRLSALSTVEGGHPKEESCAAGQEQVDIKLARLNTLTLESASMYIFRRNWSSYGPSPNLGLEPREISPVSRLLYKWAMPAMKKARYAVEEATGQALDWSAEEGLTRNQLLFESAVPLAKLYEPFLHTDDTFILQEYFVPKAQFQNWLRAVKPIYEEMERSAVEQPQAKSNGKEKNSESSLVMLLNTTIRFVEQDTDTVLAYSQARGGCFAFVLYFRIARTQSAEERLSQYNLALINETLKLGGTFYLPYRRCYTLKLAMQAYPRLGEFAALKEKYDASGLFHNAWFESYVLPLCSEGYTEMLKRKQERGPTPMTISMTLEQNLKKNQKIFKHHSELPRADARDLATREGSYRKLLSDKNQKEAFRKEFLVRIFNVAPPEEVIRVMSRAAWDGRNVTDVDIFRELRKHFHGDENTLNGDAGAAVSPISQFKQKWSALVQLRRQKKEIFRQTCAILSRLGKMDSITSLCSMGDHGKLVSKFCRTFHKSKDFASDLQHVFIVHDTELDEVNDIGGVLERGSLDPVGKFCLYDYMTMEPTVLEGMIPTNSCDVVTMMQGLHHIPQEYLIGFLQQVERILAPGGVFLFREHDLKLEDENGARIGQARVEMLDLAHSVFNAITGVTEKDERRELRAFRPIREWREVVSGCCPLLEDNMLYEIEVQDPTWDEMVTFQKRGPSPGPSPESQTADVAALKLSPTSPSLVTRAILAEQPPVVELINVLCGQIPAAVFKYIRELLQMVTRDVGSGKRRLDAFMAEGSSDENGFKDCAETSHQPEPDALESAFRRMVVPKILSVASNVTESLEIWKTLLEESEVQEFYDVSGLLDFPELWIIAPFLQRQAAMDPENNANAVKAVDMIESYAPFLLVTSKDSDAEGEANGNANGKESQGATSTPESSRRGSTAWSPRTNKGFNSDGSLPGPLLEAELNELEAAIPGLLSPTTLQNSGFSVRQQTALAGQFGGKDVPGMCENLGWYINPVLWKEMKMEFGAIKVCKEKPTHDMLLGYGSYSRKDGDPRCHPWCRLFKIFLRSPRIRLQGKAKFGLQMLGLSELLTMLDEAQAKRVAKKKATSDVRLMDTSQMDSSDLQDMKRAARKLSNTFERKRVEFKFDEGRSATVVELHDVAYIESATFGYASLTTQPSDLTNAIRKLHEERHIGLEVDSVTGASRAVELRASGGQVRNSRTARVNINLAEEAKQKGASSKIHKPGYLRLTEEMLMDLRGQQSKIGGKSDAARKDLVNLMTLGMAGKNSLVLEYMSMNKTGALTARTSRASSNRDFGLVLEDAAAAVGESLWKGKLVKDLHREKDEEYTYFKLPEWLQVEITSLFANFLNHTAWFRFPFITIMHTYFSVLLDTADFVRKKHGFTRAFASMAFLTDAIPGIVMTFLMGQLRILAQPLLMSQPEDGYAGVDQSRLCEEVVLMLPKSSVLEAESLTAWKTLIDSRIQDVKTLRPLETGAGGSFSLHVVRVPPFKEFTYILEHIAIKLPAARILQISNQAEIHVKISLKKALLPPDFSATSTLVPLDQGVLVTDYKFPVSPDSADSEPVHHVSFSVKCVYLLGVIRRIVQTPGCQLQQIFDFWGG